MENSLPIYILINDSDGVLSAPRALAGIPGAQTLLAACVRDLLQQCVSLPGAQLWLCGAPPSLVSSLAMVPVLHGRIPRMSSKMRETPRGLVIAADTATLPPGYLHSAIDALSADACAEVSGPLPEDGLYLLGWSQGKGKMTLPAWYRILYSSDGIIRARRDLVRGTVAPATARALSIMACNSAGDGPVEAPARRERNEKDAAGMEKAKLHLLRRQPE